jgi:hypothetical protein
MGEVGRTRVLVLDVRDALDGRGEYCGMSCWLDPLLQDTWAN